MMYFLFGIVFGWLIGLTYSQFRRETPKENVWEFKPTTQATTIDSGFFKENLTSEQKAEFLAGDRVGEIIKNKEDVRLDDILV